MNNRKNNRTGMSLLAVACFSLLGVTYARLEASSFFWDPATGGNGHYYEVVPSAEAISWLEAKAQAESAGGYLATITSSNENAFVFSLIANDERIWRTIPPYSIGPYIGGFQMPSSPEPAGGWEWVTGEPMVFTAWKASEPNNVWGDNAIHYESVGARSPTWNDIPDTLEPILSHLSSNNVPPGFIIEYNSNPGPVASIRVSEVEISWQSMSNINYQVQYVSTLTTNTWTTLPTGTCIQGDGTGKAVYDKIAAGQPQRFYRVVVTNCVP